MAVVQFDADCSSCRFVDDSTIQTALRRAMDLFHENWRVTLECPSMLAFSSALCRFDDRLSSQECSDGDAMKAKCCVKKLRKGKFHHRLSEISDRNLRCDCETTGRDLICLSGDACCVVAVIEVTFLTRAKTRRVKMKTKWIKVLEKSFIE